jgi:hypothetical protein
VHRTIPSRHPPSNPKRSSAVQTEIPP